jgi:hypothetical protein
LKNYLIRDIPEDLLKSLKHKAVEEDTSMRNLILQYIEEGLKKDLAKGKAKK